MIDWDETDKLREQTELRQKVDDLEGRLAEVERRLTYDGDIFERISALEDTHHQHEGPP